SIALLGSTGSIGTQTLEVCQKLQIPVLALAAGKNVDLLESQAREFKPRLVAMSDTFSAAELKKRLSGTGIRVLGGDGGVLECAAHDCGTVVNAIVGSAGLDSTVKAVSLGRRLALANKESLVCAGKAVMALAKETGAEIIPVDSEHSAIFQCLRASDGNRIKRLILTASGGAFYGWSKERLKNVTVTDALRHPNWSMGPKVTIDSATMMNKGLEVIEAMHLFGLAPERISVLIHRQSILHSAVEFEDGSVIAQLGSPDMRTPIQYALTYPARRPCPAPALDLAKIGTLTFDEPDFDLYPCLKLAYRCAGLGDDVCRELNDANERAVARFISGEIDFPGIFESVGKDLENIGVCI
ncbi:MAG: 1-deoxy-D-xylulose-5-phosphate reductoisomerase, partial [Clostridiales bacterium]|nr:1-deoxy-D-xylulose-5-phosphate reductoisomerase [Clostridiales bacterium]